MPWFWGSKGNNDNDESSYEEYTDEEYSSGEYYSDEEEYESSENEEEEAEESDGVLVEAASDQEKDDPKEQPSDALDVTNDANELEASPTNAVAACTIDNNNDDDDDKNMSRNTDDEWVPDHIGGDSPRRFRQRSPSALTLEYEEEYDDDDGEGQSGSSAKQQGSSNHEIPEEDHSITSRAEDGEPGVVEVQQLPHGHDDEEEEEEEEDDHDTVEDEEEEPETTLAEKQSLLVLAAEHDRVDIVNSILNPMTTNASNKNDASDADAAAATDDQETRRVLLNGNGDIPPLHIAVSYGSTSTVQCLLRLGANPSVRPGPLDDESERSNRSSAAPPVDIPHRYRFYGKSAWELLQENSNAKKRQAMEHGFTAEALRCLGGDESYRLHQLVEAGLSADTDISGKTLYEWAVTMEAKECQELLSPEEENSSSIDNGEIPVSRVLDRPNTSDDTGDSVASLRNQLHELTDLSRALSGCVDELAEEATVCAGLLVQGGGAAALATHVRSLKQQISETKENLDKRKEDYETIQDELAYWKYQNGGKDLDDDGDSDAKKTKDVHEPEPNPADSAENEAETIEELKSQIETTEANIRKFRASLVDLGDANARDLAQVEARGLQGGLQLVRNLREELRTLNSDVDQLETAIPACRERIHKWSAKLSNGQHQHQSAVMVQRPPSTADASTMSDLHDIDASSSNNSITENGGSKAIDNGEDTLERLISTKPSSADSSKPSSASTTTPSFQIATGQSTALALRNESRGFFPLSLWQILLRIIGIRDSAAAQAAVVAAAKTKTAPRSSGVISSGVSIGSGSNHRHPAMII